MFYRLTFYFTTLLIALIFLSVRDVSAQKCIGGAAYVVRDELGKIMSPEEMKKMIIKLDGLTQRRKGARRYCHYPWRLCVFA